ncbi:MAG: YybH family protein [Pseudonocardiaceae bacterium]
MVEKAASNAIRIENLEDSAKIFQDVFNAGDLDGMVSLYEPEAVFVPVPGQVAVGSDAIRDVFTGFLATWGWFELKVFSRHQAGDIALTTA